MSQTIESALNVSPVTTSTDVISASGRNLPAVMDASYVATDDKCVAGLQVVNVADKATFSLVLSLMYRHADTWFPKTTTSTAILRKIGGDACREFLTGQGLGTFNPKTQKRKLGAGTVAQYVSRCSDIMASRIPVVKGFTDDGNTPSVFYGIGYLENLIKKAKPKAVKQDSQAIIKSLAVEMRKEWGSRIAPSTLTHEECITLVVFAMQSAGDHWQKVLNGARKLNTAAQPKSAADAERENPVVQPSVIEA